MGEFKTHNYKNIKIKFKMDEGKHFYIYSKITIN